MTTSAGVVVDASLGLKLVLTEPYTPEARTLVRGWTVDGLSRLAPTLFAYETTNTLYRKQPAPDAEHVRWVALSVADLLAVVALVPPDLALLERAAAIAAQLGRPAAYDAQYAALAEREDYEFWTADERFWRAARSQFFWVRWVGEAATLGGGSR